MSGVDVVGTGAVILEVSNVVTSSTVVDNLAGEAANTKDVNDAEMQKYGPPSSTSDSAGNERCTFKDIWSLNNIPVDIMQYSFNSAIKSLLNYLL